MQSLYDAMFGVHRNGPCLMHMNLDRHEGPDWPFTWTDLVPLLTAMHA